MDFSGIYITIIVAFFGLAIFQCTEQRTIPDIMTIYGQCMGPRILSFCKANSHVTCASITGGGPLCLECKYVLRPDECAHVTTCGDHEQCYMQQYVTSSGFILYDLGCEDSMICRSQTAQGPVFGRKRKVVTRDSDDKVNVEMEDGTDGRTITCESCCNDTDICNVGGLCSTQRPDLHGGRFCYNCEQQFSEKDCDRITLCHQDRLCYIHQRQSTTSNYVYWSTGCSDIPQNCSSNTGINRCASCCTDNLCNNNCKISAQPQTSAPVTNAPTTQPPKITPQNTPSATTTATPKAPAKVVQILIDPQPIHYGGTVRVMCLTSGTPTPKVGWNMRIPDNQLITNVVQELDGRLLVINNYSKMNDGDYRCVATNYVQDSKVVSLQGTT